MKGFKFSGVSDRLESAMRRAGYERADGALDIMRFCKDHGFQYVYVYNWVRMKRTPTLDHVQRLASILNVAPAWLLLGDEGMVPPGEPLSVGAAATRTHRAQGRKAGPTDQPRPLAPTGKHRPDRSGRPFT